MYRIVYTVTQCTFALTLEDGNAQTSVGTSVIGPLNHNSNSPLTTSTGENEGQLEQSIGNVLLNMLIFSVYLSYCTGGRKQYDGSGSYMSFKR